MLKLVKECTILWLFCPSLLLVIRLDLDSLFPSRFVTPFSSPLGLISGISSESD